MLLIASAPGRFSGSLADQERLHRIVQDVEGGYIRSVAFVVPSGPIVPVPLYELALMLADGRSRWASP